MRVRAFDRWGGLRRFSRVLSVALSLLVLGMWNAAPMLCVGLDGGVALEVGVHGHCADCEQRAAAAAHAPGESHLVGGYDGCSECVDVLVPGTDRASGRPLELPDPGLGMAALVPVHAGVPQRASSDVLHVLATRTTERGAPARLPILRC